MVLIPALPLAAAIFTAIFGKHLLGPRAHLPTVLAIIASFLCSLPVLFEVREQAAEHGTSLAAEHDGGAHEGGTRTVGWEHTVDLWRWLHVESVLAAPPAAVEIGHVAGQPTKLPPRLPFDIDITLRVDPLTSIMLSMVTFIASLVAIYASGYMHGDPGYWRFFSYIGLFVFSMTMLVSSSNFVLLYTFWEAVGVCSYLLVGFWYEKPEAAAAGKKAFLVNRVGDVGFALGLFLVYVTYGTLNFHDTEGLAGVLGQTRLASPSLYVGGATATAIGLLLLVGACGKSAQFPLHVWLPDAMEGPTPVSADPRGHHGHGWRLHGDALYPPLFSIAFRPRRRGFDRYVHGSDGRHHRPDADRPETSVGLFDDQSAGLHVSGARHRHVAGHLRRHVPLVHARFL